MNSWCRTCTKIQWQKDKHDPVARERRAARNKEWRAANPDKFSRGVRSATLKKKYGITVEQYDDMLSKQNGCCAICGNNDSLGNGSLHVDHDHVTGKVRGILCQPCNSGLGKFRDRQDLLLNAIRYLQGE